MKNYHNKMKLLKIMKKFHFSIEITQQQYKELKEFIKNKIIKKVQINQNKKKLMIKNLLNLLNKEKSNLIFKIMKQL